MINSMVYRWIGITLLASFSQWGLAFDDLSGSRDAELIQRYSDSAISHFTELSTSDYTVYASKLRKVNGVWSAKKQQRLSGNLLRVTYRIPDNHSVDLVEKFFFTQLDNLKGDTLFKCEKRGCGSSNQWANMVFGVKELYGPDRNQVYRVEHIQKNGKEYFLALYVIERGNRRVYAHIDFLSVSQVKPSVLSQLNTGKHISIFADASPKLKERSVLQLVAFLKENPQKDLLIVGHSYGGGAVDELQSKSLAAAKSVAKQLSTKLKDAQLEESAIARIRVYGVGPLAPLSSLAQGEDRVVFIPVDG